MMYVYTCMMYGLYVLDTTPMTCLFKQDKICNDLRLKSETMIMGFPCLWNTEL